MDQIVIEYDSPVQEVSIETMFQKIHAVLPELSDI